LKYMAVTSFSQEGYNSYGRKMIESFIQNVDENINLIVYTDDFLSDVDPSHEEHPRITFKSMRQDAPGQMAFEERHQSPICHGRFGTFYDYRFDAVRFSHKPAAILAAYDFAPDTDVLIWFDADTVFKKPLTTAFLDKKFPTWAHVGYFPRHENHMEGGIITFRSSHDNVKAFLRIMWQVYEQDQLFRLDGWTDCHVIESLIAGAQKDGFLRAVNLGDDVSKGTHHPIVNSEWFKYVDHLKGARKEAGASYESDIQVQI
jgi:hypothetical protein